MKFQKGDKVLIHTTGTIKKQYFNGMVVRIERAETTWRLGQSDLDIYNVSYRPEDNHNRVETRAEMLKDMWWTEKDFSETKQRADGSFLIRQKFQEKHSRGDWFG